MLLPDALTTVSRATPTSCRCRSTERARPHLPSGINILTGILNGIDTSIWNPKTGSAVAITTADDLANKADWRALREETACAKTPRPLW